MKISKYLIPCVIVILLVLFRKNIIPGLIIIFIHELVHLITARAMGFSGFTIDILPIGTTLRVKELDEAEPMEDMIISLSGPVSNIILALTLFLINIFMENPIIYKFAFYNLIIGIFNMIPAFPLDGGRILRDILNFKFLYKKSNKIALNVSIVIGYIFGAVFLIMLLWGEIYIDLAIFSIFILIVSYREKRRIAYLIMGYILKKREKLINRGYLENKSISVYFKLNILQLIELIDKNKYNEFIVLNKEMKVIGVLYEEDILNAIKDLGNITLEELISINGNVK